MATDHARRPLNRALQGCREIDYRQGQTPMRPDAIHGMVVRHPLHLCIYMHNSIVLKNNMMCGMKRP